MAPCWRWATAKLILVNIFTPFFWYKLRTPTVQYHYTSQKRWVLFFAPRRLVFFDMLLHHLWFFKVLSPSRYILWYAVTSSMILQTFSHPLGTFFDMLLHHLWFFKLSLPLSVHSLICCYIIYDSSNFLSPSRYILWYAVTSSMILQTFSPTLGTFFDMLLHRLSFFKLSLPLSVHSLICCYIVYDSSNFLSHSRYILWYAVTSSIILQTFSPPLGTFFDMLLHRLWFFKLSFPLSVHSLICCYIIYDSSNFLSPSRYILWYAVTSSMILQTFSPPPGTFFDMLLHHLWFFKLSLPLPVHSLICCYIIYDSSNFLSPSRYIHWYAVTSSMILQTFSPPLGTFFDMLLHHLWFFKLSLPLSVHSLRCCYIIYDYSNFLSPSRYIHWYAVTSSMILQTFSPPPGTFFDMLLHHLWFFKLSFPSRCILWYAVTSSMILQTFSPPLSVHLSYKVSWS